MEVEPKQTATPAEAPKWESPNITPPKDFDVDAYISNYSGHARYRRLLFLATRSKELESDCLKRAIDELKKTQNAVDYRELYEKAADKIDKLGPQYALDKTWLDACDKKAAQTQERLENELNSSRTALLKENIRTGHNELGDFHYERGDLNSALKCYVRARDYCATSKHVLQMCLNVIKVSIELHNFSHVNNYVSKAESTADQDSLTTAKLKVVAGLGQLEQRKYKPAARKFIEVSPELGSQYGEVISPQDIAIYGGLIALASFDRQELKKKVLDSVPFKSFLETAPTIRELLQDFYCSRYASCLDHLARLKLELDFFFSEHVNFLFDKIRAKAIVQYFSPFVSVNLNTMADALKTNVPALEKELSRLIMEGQISARIDSHNKILYARTVDQRNSTYEKALQVGDETQRQTKALLLRVNFMRTDFYVRPPRSQDDEPIVQPQKRV